MPCSANPHAGPLRMFKYVLLLKQDAVFKGSDCMSLILILCIFSIPGLSLNINRTQNWIKPIKSILRKPYHINLHLFLPLSLPLRLVSPHAGSSFLSFLLIRFSFPVSSSLFPPSFSSFFLLPPSSSNPLLLWSRLHLQRWLGAKDGPREIILWS